jgi:hypothetical protein
LFVIGPKRHCIAVALVYARLDANLKSGDGAIDVRESSRKLNLEVCNLTAGMRDSSKDVTRE